LLDALYRAVVLKPARLSAQEIAYLRRCLDLSQRQLSELVGVSEQTVSLWERGAHGIDRSAETVLRKFSVESRHSAFKGSRASVSIASLAQLGRSCAAFLYEATFVGGNWSVKLDLMRKLHTQATISIDTTVSADASVAGGTHMRTSNVYPIRLNDE